VPLEDAELAREVLGPRDRNLRRVREAMGVTAVLRGEKLILDGPHDQVERAAAAMAEICRVARTLGCISKDEVERIVEGAAGAPLQEDAPACAEARGGTPAPGPSTRQARLPVGRGREVEARTAGQAYYIETMRGHDIVFSVGPAGTGKTYLSVAAGPF